MASKEFKLLLIRHGQGFHNLGIYGREELEFTEDETLKTMNSSLTEKGLNQARLVGERLKNKKFDLVISSDLKRAKQTAEIIVDLNNSIDHFEEWKDVRERCVGDFEGNEIVDSALITVEKAVKNRNYLTWRPPNGESVVDLRIRIKQVLKKVQLLALKSSTDIPMIVVVSHGAFMNELYYLLSEECFSQGMSPEKEPKYHNTGISQYHFTTCIDLDKAEWGIEEAKCEIFSCGSHLRNEDVSYQGCFTGCCLNE